LNEIRNLKTTKERGDKFEQFTKFFLQNDPLYKVTLKHVWLRTEVPQNVARHLALPSEDMGIDIVAETRDGEYWAIQCKYRYDTTQSLTWDELGTFVGLNKFCPNFSFMMVVSTADSLVDFFKGKSISTILSDTWMGLSDSFYDEFETHQICPTLTLTPRSLRPDQVKSVKEIIEFFSIESRAKLHRACGTGKTLIMYHVTKMFSRNVIFVPSLNLVSQTLREYMREAAAENRILRYLVVASDDTIGDKNNDDIKVLTNELGVPVTTDSRKIASFLKKSGDFVVFCTYQSSAVLGKAARKTSPFDFAAYDEAHKTVGKKDGMFAYPLFDNHIKVKNRLFATATERFFRNGSDDVVDMNNKKVYGDKVSFLSFKSAIQMGILSDYEILVPIVSNEEVKRYIEKNKLVADKNNPKSGVDMRSVAAAISMHKAAKQYPITHVISFHNRVSRAEEFSKYATETPFFKKKFGHWDGYFISGEMNSVKRSRIITHFKNAKKAIISNARCLTEGVDIPCVNGILFADPRQSKIDIVQAFGRVLRKFKGKEKGYIIIPQVVNSNAKLDTEHFAYMKSVIAALASVDERLQVECDMIRDGKIPKTRIIKVGGKTDTDNAEFFESIDMQKVYDSIEIAIADKVNLITPNTPYFEAKKYVQSFKFESTGEYNEWYSAGQPTRKEWSKMKGKRSV
jgi:predicted helicase